jgi:1,3-beta-glucanosyltransferase GAS1
MVSGYSELQKNASNYDLPIFLSETGCNDPEPRTFQDQSAIFGPQMAGTWSGAIIYEWIQEANNYGLVSYGPEVAATATQSNIVDGFTRSGTPTPISPDFENLSSQWATLSPTGVSENAYSPTHSPPPCPSYTSGMWELSGNVQLPTIGATGTQFTTPATGASASSTSSSSAAAATKVPPGPLHATHTSLRRRSGEPLFKFFSDLHRDVPGLWWVLISIISCAGIGLLV